MKAFAIANDLILGYDFQADVIVHLASKPPWASIYGNAEGFWQSDNDIGQRFFRRELWWFRSVTSV
jgi:hypothetical protein